MRRRLSLSLPTPVLHFGVDFAGKDILGGRGRGKWTVCLSIREWVRVDGDYPGCGGSVGWVEGHLVEVCAAALDVAIIQTLLFVSSACPPTLFFRLLSQRVCCPPRLLIQIDKSASACTGGGTGVSRVPKDPKVFIQSGTVGGGGNAQDIVVGFASRLWFQA